MSSNSIARRIFLFYAPLVPLISVAIAFGVGHLDYQIYLPIWIIHSVVMLGGAWIIGVHFIKSNNKDEQRTAVIGLCFMLPWIIASIFAGMGPPPFTKEGWAELAFEQYVRFCLLIGCGIVLSIGFSLLYQHLQLKGELLYSRIAITCIKIAIPLFIITTASWGAFITDLFKIIAASSTKQSPEWLGAVINTIEMIIHVWVGLIYFATLVISKSIKTVQLLGATAANAYMIASAFALIVSFAPSSGPEPFATMSYLVGIPAVTIIIPYLFGINLLKGLSKA